MTGRSIGKSFIRRYAPEYFMPGLYRFAFLGQYEELGAECCSTVGIEEIDKPEFVEDRFKGIKRKNLEFPVSKTVRRWVEEHEEEIDECK